MSRSFEDGSAETTHLKKDLDIAQPTFLRPDFDAFCMLRNYGVTITGQHVTAEQAALECRVVEADQFCQHCGADAKVRGSLVRRVTHVPVGWRPTQLRLRLRRYRCDACACVGSKTPRRWWLLKPSLLPESTTGLALQAGFDATFGHSWFTTQDHQHESFPEVLSAAHRVFDALDDDEYGNTSYASVQAVGVGQGAALATTMLRVRPEAFSALVGINGYVIDNPMLAALDHPAGRDDAIRVLWISDGTSDSPAAAFSREWLAAHTRLTEADTTSAIAAFLAGIR